ncbi:hypothetical protein ACMXYO_15020 [Neptuniibacter sp. QD37_6]|uniref:hypothetical protein n=1 Tax=Neptuniibacter sp. QD37_6 TaxID=3398210 RepID=UPI0039F457C1
MEFITKGDTIKCVRQIKDKVSGKENHITVASFNAQVDRLPPHVAAELFTEEVKELVLWLEDRTKLQSQLARQSIDDTILESLPFILRQATQALENLERLDLMLYCSINEGLSDLSEVLDKTERFTSTHKVGSMKMQNSEEQKERLYTIKKDIEENE